jgi:signal recognition particle receptor subunit beta
MSDRDKIIKYFCSRFLNIETVPKSFSDILDLPTNSLKGCSTEETAKLSKHHIRSIRDLAKIDYREIDKVSEKAQIDVNQLRKWVLASQLVSRAWQKRSSYLKKSEIKIAVLGLDNAGKTSMLETLSGASNLGDVIDLAPTVGVDVRKLESEKTNLVVWDFGGQVGHRHDYLQNPEDYFLQIDLMIYVIDMQNPDRFDESLEYVKQIFDVITFLKEHPYVLILLHKSDPDFIKDPDYEINQQYIYDEIGKIFNPKELNYEIIQTSIYNYYATEPEFAQIFKRFFGMKGEKKSIEELISGLTEIFLKTSNNLLDEIKSLKTLINTSVIQVSDGKTVLPQSGGKTKSLMSTKDDSFSLHAPPPNPPKISDLMPKPGKIQTAQDTRANLLSELKDMFKKRGLTDRE